MSDYPRRAFVPIEVPVFRPIPDQPTTRDIASSIRELAITVSTLATVADNNFAAMFDRVKMIMLALKITEDQFRAKMETLPDEIEAISTGALQKMSDKEAARQLRTLKSTGFRIAVKIVTQILSLIAAAVVGHLLLRMFDHP
jgi:hypothetical protein